MDTKHPDRTEDIQQSSDTQVNSRRRPFIVYVLLFFVATLVLFTLATFFIEMSDELEFKILFVLLGSTLVASALTAFSANTNKTPDEQHTAVAPYAGTQKVSPKLAKVFNGILLLMGLITIILPFIF